MLVADIDPNAPWWVAGAMSIVTISLAALRVYDYYKKKRSAWTKDDYAHQQEVKQDLTEEQREARRDSATEAWQVVDRLTKEVEGHGAKLREIEERERKCSEDRAEEQAAHAQTRTMLRMLVAWARKQRNPPPIPEDMLRQLNLDDGSKPHNKLGDSNAPH